MPKTIEQPDVVKQLTPERKQTLRSALSDPLRSMRMLTKGSLYHFMQYFWDTYSGDKFTPNWHIELMCKELEEIARRVGRGETKKHDLVINVPPGTTKTATISIFFPVWCWVNWYWIRFISTSHSKDLSNESAEYSRDIIRSEKFQQMFPDLDIQQDKDVKSNFRVVKKNYVSPGRVPRIEKGGGRKSTSVDARIIGFHGHIILIDDIIDPKRAISEVGLQNAQDHMKTLATRKTDKRITATILIMQRLHQEDPTGYMLKTRGEKVRHICLPGEITQGYEEFVKPKELLENYSPDGLLDPVRLGWNELKELEEVLGQYGYAGQVGQNPTPPGGGMFKVNMIPILDQMPKEGKIIRTVRYWDKAGTQDGGAYTVGLKMHLLTNGTFLISDIRRGQWSTEDREDTIKATARADSAKVRIGVEQEPGSGGKESAQATIRRLVGFSVLADRPTGDKVFRADPFSVQVNNGNVALLRGDWNVRFIEEMLLFPLGKYKDQVDAGSGAFHMLTQKKQARTLKHRKK